MTGPAGAGASRGLSPSIHHCHYRFGGCDLVWLHFEKIMGEQNQVCQKAFLDPSLLIFHEFRIRGVTGVSQDTFFKRQALVRIIR